MKWQGDPVEAVYDVAEQSVGLPVELEAAQMQRVVQADEGRDLGHLLQLREVPAQHVEFHESDEDLDLLLVR